MSSQFSLLAKRRFLPLFVTQALGAFNDNVLKNAIAILITYRLATEQGLDAATVIALATGLFILPFFLFSGLAGQLADKHDKAALTRRLKIAEIAIMVFGGYALWSGSVWLQLFALFLTGVQSAFFGPIKYGILPQHLRPQELLGGNGLVEAGTFLAILFGTIFGGLLILTTYGVAIVWVSMICFAALGWLAARSIPRAEPPAPEIVVDYNILRSTLRVFRFAAERRDVLNAILGIGWFWFLGAVFIAEMPVLARDVLGADEKVANLFNVAFVIGIGAGSLLTNRLLHGEVTPRYVPLAALAISIVVIDLWRLTAGLAAPAGDELATIGTFFSTGLGWRVFLDLVLIALFGGIYVVPLFAYMQAFSERAHLSRVIAANNVVGAAFMTAASAFVVLALQNGLSVPRIFLVTGIANLLVAACLWRLLARQSRRFAT